MRSLPSGVITQFGSGNATAVLLIEMVFDAGTLRVTNCGQDVPWGANTFKGVGVLGTMESIKETETGEVLGVKFSLTGVDAAFISQAQQEPYQGRIVTVYLGAFALPNYTLIPDPTIEWAGTLDVPVIKDNNDGFCSIEVTAEHELFDFDRPNVLTYTDAEQQKLFPGDLGCQYAEQMATREIQWPSAEYFKQ
jgi:hypothetical protein